MDERERRVGLNQINFRRANERLVRVAEGLSLVAERTQFICECGSASCVEPISLTLAEYEHVRSEPTWFVVKHGHDNPGVDRMVEEHASYAIVEKLPGGPAGLAIREEGEP
jgi:hypothetical protein